MKIASRSYFLMRRLKCVYVNDCPASLPQCPRLRQISYKPRRRMGTHSLVLMCSTLSGSSNNGFSLRYSIPKQR